MILSLSTLIRFYRFVNEIQNNQNWDVDNWRIQKADQQSNHHQENDEICSSTGTCEDSIDNDKEENTKYVEVEVVLSKLLDHHLTLATATKNILNLLFFKLFEKCHTNRYFRACHRIFLHKVYTSDKKVWNASSSRMQPGNKSNSCKLSPIHLPQEPLCLHFPENGRTWF